ncbi:uncharacterized protein LOC111329440 isoform X4 [Stylophora pistillata]|uniref:uncharacterized protein LOC111329440 isoform X4 n=1 Tax=Stylophora pistillata TaxID=50429 RepID=UPI000C053201|nr:uncharacterized protein LOC111329440 isoform X4 [Stylophora pistillata]
MFLLSPTSLLFICVFTWTYYSGSSFTDDPTGVTTPLDPDITTAISVHIGCGSLRNNSLQSPGYPNSYPRYMDCVYQVNITQGMAMKISFDDFELQEDSACSYDYVEISSQDNFRFGKYCGEDSGTTIEVTGDYAVIRFHSDSNVQKRGFSLLFTSVLPSPPDISVPDVVRVFAGEKVTCSVTGSFPIYTTILKNSTVLVNTTSMATIQLHKDGNYTCVATSKYGTDVQMFSVILFDCGSLKNNSLQSPGYPNGYQSNLDCVWQITIPHGMAMWIHFHDFELEGDLCWYDYVEISNENNFKFGKYCGKQTGKTVEITGDYAVIKFHSDSADQERGFSLLFTAISPSPPIISMPAVERAFVSEEMTCSATGSPPIYTAILKESTVLINITTSATVRFREEGNYSCVATSKFGTDVWKVRVIIPGCGSLRNSSLQSPEYPNSYPRNMDCLYQVNIPYGMTMKIYFEDFALEEASLCRDDYVEISNQNNFTFGKYCGIQTGRTVEVSGDYAVITFHSDFYGQTRGFSLLFTAVLPSPPIIAMPALVRAFPGNEVICSVTGSPPIYTVILNDSIVLVNTTNTASVKFFKEGNYSCMATSKYGSDFTVFTVLDCRPTCSFGLRFYGWTLSCTNATPSYLKECLPGKTENLDLSSNAIKSLPDGLFAEVIGLKNLDLSSNAIKSLPDGLFAEVIGLKNLDLSSNALASLPETVFSNLTSLQILDLSSNAIAFLPGELFANLTRLRHLDLSSNTISFLPETVFANLTSLHTLHLSSNSIASLPSTLFSKLALLESLDISSNIISTLPEGLFAKLTRLEKLDLHFNMIHSLPEGIFPKLNLIKYLDLSLNTISFLPEGCFTKLTMLRYLYLPSNAITFIPEGIFPKLNWLIRLDLSSNAITILPEGSFDKQTELSYLYLSSNGITSLPEGLFTKMIRLNELHLSRNALTSLPRRLFVTQTRLLDLDLSDNAITSLPEGLFATQTWLWHLFLDRNNLQRIPRRAFYAMKYISIIALSDNPIQAIESEAFNFYSSATSRLFLLRTNLKTFKSDSFANLNVDGFKLYSWGKTPRYIAYYHENKTMLEVYLNPTESHRGVLKFTSSYFSIARLQSAMLWMGFTHTVDHFTRQNLFRPCPLGTFSAGYGKCFRCPPGGFYSDTLAYVAKGCKKCPNGSYVPFDKTPGKSILDCKACPLGTESDFFAGHRACPCLEGFYRTHRFAECRKCGNGGLLCQDDYASLKSGFWWQWRNESLKHHYQNFIQNLLSPSPRLLTAY